MSSLIDLLRRIFGVQPEGSSSREPQMDRPEPTRAAPTRQSAAPTQLRQTRPSPNAPTRRDERVDPAAKTILAGPRPAETAPNHKDVDEYLERIDKKINRLAEEFAQGVVNREQFQQLFEHYQQERTSIQNWKESTEGSGDWREISSEGESIVIRTKHSAKVLGYAIYANESGMPLTTIGDFDIDPDLAVPMLSSYRSAAKEIFGGEMRSTEIEGGKWLCFVPGSSTTMLALFTLEPAARQLKIMEDLHRLFEKANRRHLAGDPIDPEALAFPHASYLGRLQ